MNRKAGSERSANVGAASVALFVCLFAAQAAVIAMAPVLAEAASDLDVPTAAAGQLRTISGLAAGITALAIGLVAGRVGVGRQLPAAAALLAVASIASAAAPTFVLLALAQVPVGVAVAVLTGAGTLAAAEWAPPELRTRTLSWALVSQPAAWIVGMPLVGVLGEHSWRYAWLALPLVAAVAAGSSSFRARSRRLRSRALRALVPFSPTASSRGGLRPSCSRTRRGRGRSCSPARSSPSRTERARG